MVALKYKGFGVEVGIEFLPCPDYSQTFLYGGVVIISLLKKDGTKAIIRSISLDEETLVKVGQLYDQSGCQGFLDLVKGSVALICPSYLCELMTTCQVCQWFDECAKVGNTFSLVPHQV